ncbi:hypothetical protein CIHG_03428 [Coccidioides immitis H538.4]|uniref:Uncharacterized protein n=1 Tax=Coccidioides immitis H538.4 TaxID=396776 RepID=A0A0J8RPH8_COCIT|nr:hypothetical protein CIHG_03428 [Coccidioides immitis H538.4]
MSVGFGFSVGDFLAALRLVGTVIDALRESSNSGSTYRELLNELYSLETALLRVKRIDLDGSQHAEKIALQQAAAQCQRTIDSFWKKVEKYQPHLQGGGTNSKLKDGWSRIKWAVCRKDDIQNFRAEIAAHTSSIEVLLLTVQMNATTMHARAEQRQYGTLAGKIQALSNQGMSKLAIIADSIAQGVQPGRRLLETSEKVLQTNLRVFQMIHDIQRFLLHIPTQVQRQQPVYMIDAFNKESPFHLEFVRSAEALISILKVNFKASGCGPGMIDRGEFLIEESGTQNLIDISKPWETCFYPGQRVAMCMLFKEKRVRASCPRCGAEFQGPTDKEVECITCGTVFCRVKEPSRAVQTPMWKDIHPDEHVPLDPGKMNQPGKRKHRENDKPDIQMFRRVRIINPMEFARPDTGLITKHNLFLRMKGAIPVDLWKCTRDQALDLYRAEELPKQQGLRKIRGSVVSLT